MAFPFINSLLIPISCEIPEVIRSDKESKFPVHNLPYGSKTSLPYRVVVRITEMMNMLVARHSDIITAGFARALFNY